MDLLQFTDINLFKSVSLDQETLILVSKDSKYTFHINFKDEIKGVDFYELAIATQTSSGYINKSGTAKVIQKFVLEVLNNDHTNLKDDNTKILKDSNVKIDNKKNTPRKKVSASSKSNSSKKFYQNIKR